MDEINTPSQLVLANGPEVLGHLARAIGISAILYIIYLAYLIIYNLYFHPLARFPGPIAFAATPAPFVFAQITGNLPFIYKKLHERYGDVVRVLPNELSFNNAGAWRDIYYTRNGKTVLPKDFEAAVPSSDGVFNLVSSANVAEHARFRRVLNPIFSESAIRQQERLVVGHTDLLARQLREKSSKGPQDLVTWLNLLAFDVTSDLVFGDSLDQLRTGEFHPWVRGLSGSTMKFISLQRAFRKFPHIKFILDAFTPKTLIEQRKKHFAFAAAQFEKRINEPRSRYDFMTHVLPYDADEVAMSIPEMRENFGALVIAGSENVATTIAFTLYFILTDGKVYAKAVQEIREHFKENAEISFASITHLPYLRAVLNEAMRMMPAAPASQPRVVPPGGIQIVDQHVPGGARVSVPPLCIHRDSRYFKDPDSFIPERWLDKPEDGDLDERSAFQPFGVGPRSCAGRSLALSWVKLVVAKLLWNFDMKLDTKDERWADSLKVYHLWHVTPFHVHIQPRQMT